MRNVRLVKLPQAPRLRSLIVDFIANLGPRRFYLQLMKHGLN